MEAESKKKLLLAILLVYKVDGMVLSGGQPPLETVLVRLADL